MKVYRIYTDGSHLKHTSGRLGIGGVLVYGDQLIDKFSMEVAQEFMRVNYGTSDVSNPTCEMLATYVALGKFKEHLKDASEVICYADYQGVQGWCKGAWKINKPYILQIKNDIDKEIKEQGLKGKVRFEWVKGHQAYAPKYSDAYWNGLTDELAKGGYIQ